MLVAVGGGGGLVVVVGCCMLSLLLLLLSCHAGRQTSIVLKCFNSPTLCALFLAQKHAARSALLPTASPLVVVVIVVVRVLVRVSCFLLLVCCLLCVEAYYVLYLIVVVPPGLRPSFPPSVGIAFSCFCSCPQTALAQESAFTTTTVVLLEMLISPMVLYTFCIFLIFYLMKILIFLNCQCLS